jgi:citrate lyase beta subunit
VRYFSTLPSTREAALFHRPPEDFFRDSPPHRLAIALGATLYTPAVRPHLAEDIARCHRAGVMSMVCCLEDAIRDDEVNDAELHLARQLRRYAADGNEGPMLFVRVRSVEQISRLADRLNDLLPLLSGFVLPKFRPDTVGHAGIETVRKVGADAGLPMYVMPVLETPELTSAESRPHTLRALHGLLDAYRDSILAVRVGGTDMCGLYGLRRPVELTAWDIGVVAAVFADIVNVFGRRDGSGFVVTGPVWEYFSAGGRTREPQSLMAPFAEHRPGGEDRCPLQRSLVGLIRETTLDRANGFTGKTVIHPTHASTVHALSVVSHEEYCDAAAIVANAGRSGSGVLRSSYDNKMNEIGPHRSWAELILRRAEIFGVAGEGVTYADFLDAGDPVGGAA